MEKPWKVILAFLGVFVAGAVFGGFFSLGIGRRVLEMETPAATKPVTTALPQGTSSGAKVQKEKEKGPGGPAPQAIQTAQLMRRVTSRLDLTAEQKAAVAPIVQRSVQDIWRQQQSLYRESTFIMQRMKTDIAKELTPDQQTKLDELWKNTIDQFRKRQLEPMAQSKGERKLGRESAGAAVEKSAPAEAEKASATDVKEPAAPAEKPSGDDRK
jgi:hypothetical protein